MAEASTLSTIFSERQKKVLGEGSQLWQVTTKSTVNKGKVAFQI